MTPELDPFGIVYLRPQTKEAIALLDLEVNDAYLWTTLPPPELCDSRLGGIPERISTAHLSAQRSHGPARTMSSESTTGPYSVHPRVLRLGFDTTATHTASGYFFGSSPSCHFKMPNQHNSSSQECYFCIQYNFVSGALLIVAKSTMAVGSVSLKVDQSLLVMADTVIDCGERAFRFIVEFPDLSQCTAAHKHNYDVYVAKFKLPKPPYMATCREQGPPIGSRYRSKAFLGQGSFGEVHKSVHIETGALSAIKMIPLDEEQSTLHEVEVLCKLSHPNIIEYREQFTFHGKLCIVMELAANDLSQHRKARNAPLSLHCIRHIMHQLLKKGIEYLHGKGCMHRDLKPGNILVTEWDPQTDLPTVKLADFGLATYRSAPSSMVGTKGYVAPEVAVEWARRDALPGYRNGNEEYHYDNSVDIWALGKVLFELLAGVPGRRTLPAHNEPARHLAQLMMHPSPTKRPTASECLHHHWFPEKSQNTSQKRKASTLGETVAPPSKRVLHQMSSTTASTTTTLFTTPTPTTATAATSWSSKAEPNTVHHDATVPNLPAGLGPALTGGSPSGCPRTRQPSMRGDGRQSLTHPSDHDEAPKHRFSFR
ncbi:hypothetical protein MMC30_006810 [Trapelia coarctata]|nr:hypothetical protein [Trapelia coarctata]